MDIQVGMPYSLPYDHWPVILGNVWFRNIGELDQKASVVLGMICM
jgi:hypothetical protein